MYNYHLKEFAKIATGLVLADAISVLWISIGHLLPMNFLGATLTTNIVIPVLIFDSVVALLLAHYGWGIKLPVRTMRERGMLFTVGTLFAIVALAHWVRITFGMNLILGSWVIPVWLSWIAITVTTYLSYLSFHFALQRQR